MGSIPMMDSNFFLCPMLVSLLIISSFTFTFNSPSLSFTTNHDEIDIANPSSMQDACHIRTQLKLMASLSMTSRSSVDRVTAQCSGGHGFNSSVRDSDFFLVPCLYHCWSFYLVQSFNFHLSSSYKSLPNHTFSSCKTHFVDNFLNNDTKNSYPAQSFSILTTASSAY